MPVITASRDVRTDVRKVREHAAWLACEELPFPDFVLPFGIGDDPDLAMDFVLVSTALNFAFTDFATHRVFQVEYAGRTWWDAEALFAGMKRALDSGVPFLRGDYLAGVTRAQLAQVLKGNIEIPLLDERVEILRNVGERLAGKYGGRFCNFIRAGRPLAYDAGNGLVERLVREFPRFRDASGYRGREVKFYKLAQLGVWILHCTLRRSGSFQLEDVSRLTAFADYIVPMALHAMGILRYSKPLERAISSHKLIPRDSSREIEIRANAIYAMALLTEEVNSRRPPERHITNAHLDARLWTHFHATHQAHHLTPTIMY